MSLTIELSLSDKETAAYSADVSTATTTTYKMIPAGSCTLINLRKNHVKLRPVIPESQLDEVLAYVGMRPMQQSEALNDYQTRNTNINGLPKKSRIQLEKNYGTVLRSTREPHRL